VHVHSDTSADFFYLDMSIDSTTLVL